MSTDEKLAQTYAAAVAAADVSAVEAEPEAQLTVPVANLLEGLAVGHGLGSLRLLREAQMPGVRPDFVALQADRPCGWVELKAPGHSLDGHLWVGREKKQWALLAELDALLVCNGQQAALYRSGQLVNSPAALPYGSADGWDAGPLVDLMRLLTLSRPVVVTRTAQLADKLAPLTRMLRERISAGLTRATPVPAISQAKTAWAQHIHEHATDEEFADDLAQVIAYSLAIAALRGGADVDGDHLITLAEARQVLQASNEVLAATLGPALTIPGLGAALAAEIGAIERLVSAVDSAKIANSTDSRGEPWLWFYEDFLASYDPERRKQSGVYYTPTGVVDLQVRLVDQILRERFGRKLSYGDKAVVTLDPATGSGTYPLAVLDRASAVANAVRGHAGPAQVAPILAQNVIAFELLPGPYAVAHLRIGQRLAELAGQLVPPGTVRVYLTDTLDDPDSGPPQLGVWGDVAVLAAERERAAQVKSTQPVTVVLGNPPYRRRTAQSGGGWVVHPGAGRSLFDDVTEPPQAAGVIFSAQASLFNDYVYFWRWSIHKAFEQTPNAPAVVSFITASSWLQGPAFLGLRALARDLADEIWVVDLGGEGRGGQADDNVFAIQTPVAVVTLFRRARSTSTPAVVYYRRVTGTRSGKLAALAGIHAPLTDSVPGAASDPGDGWAVVPAAAGGRMVPTSGGLGWQAMPALTDLFPWQQPGAMLNRSWPIAPTPDLLHQRWGALLTRPDSTSRAEAYVTPATGRNIFTKVEGLKPIAELPAEAPPRPVVRYGYRSFDRQWTLQDPRLAALERPALWAALSDHQVFLTTLTTSPLGRGPALTVTTAVPDKHHFRGSYGGKDVIPVYRDATTTRPNITAGLLEVLAQKYGRDPITPEDFTAYVFAMLSHPGYQQRFAVELTTPGPRVPLTADPDLFDEGRDLGRELLWLQTYTDRYRSITGGRGTDLPSPADLGWSTPVDRIPSTEKEIRYNLQNRSLHIATGTVTGVSPEVWAYEVSGFAVVPRWLAARTARGTGRAASRPTPLDRIRPITWADEWNDELLDLVRVLTATVALEARQDNLLAQIVTTAMLHADQLPVPSATERKVPT